MALRAMLFQVPFTESPGLSSMAEIFFLAMFSFTCGSFSTSSRRVTRPGKLVAAQRSYFGSGRLHTPEILVTHRKAWLLRGRCCSRLLGAQGLWLLEALPFAVHAHPPKQAWISQPVPQGRPLRTLSRDGNSGSLGVRGCRVWGRSK